MKPEERKAMWAERICQFEESGQTAKAWCLEQEIPLSTLHYWKRKQRVQPVDAAPTEWMVYDLEPEPKRVSTLTVRMKNVAIEVPEHFNRQLLTEILDVLQDRC